MNLILKGRAEAFELSADGRRISQPVNADKKQGILTLTSNETTVGAASGD